MLFFCHCRRPRFLVLRCEMQMVGAHKEENIVCSILDFEISYLLLNKCMWNLTIVVLYHGPLILIIGIVSETLICLHDEFKCYTLRQRNQHWFLWDCVLFNFGTVSTLMHTLSWVERCPRKHHPWLQTMWHTQVLLWKV